MNISMRLSNSKSASVYQDRIFNFLRSHFGDNIEIYSDFVLEHNIEVDILIPSFELAIEYQGGQHYEEKRYFTEFQQRKRKDAMKRKYFEKHNITLIEIPYWWNGEKDSLIATIHKHRPDIFEPCNIKVN